MRWKRDEERMEKWEKISELREHQDNERGEKQKEHDLELKQLKEELWEKV